MTRRIAAAVILSTAVAGPAASAAEPASATVPAIPAPAAPPLHDALAAAGARLTGRSAPPGLDTRSAGAPVAEGPQAPATPLTLEAAIAQALANSHRLGELRAREAAALAVVDQRDAAQKPLVNTQVGYTRTNHVDQFGFLSPGMGFQVIYPDVPDNYRSRIELQWPIYTGGRLQALERAARAEAEATGLDLATARADLRLEVTRAFWALVTAREAAHVLEEALKRVEAQLSDVRARFDAGFVPPNDVFTVEAQRARQQVLLLEARNIADVAEADLVRLIGAADGTSLAPDAPLEAPSPAQPDVVPGLLVQARRDRPDRAAIASRGRAADERQAAARAGRLPTIGLLSGYDYSRPNPRIFPRSEEWNQSWDVGVNLTWNAWDAGRVRAEVAEAASVAEAARERLAEFDTVLSFEVRQRALDLESARAQITAAAEGVRAATEARRVLQERFAAGVATTTDLLDGQVALLQAELDRTRALASARLAAARLDRALGR